MLFELHLTVADHDRLDEWIEHCEAFDAKPLFIELVGSPKLEPQLMFAATFEGTEPDAQLWALLHTQAALEAGFKVVRQKLEVPLDKSADFEAPNYHEAHIKALLTPEEVELDIPGVVDSGWVVSRNSLFKEYDGREKWYFTKRAYNCDYIQAGREFAEAYDSLTRDIWGTVRMEMETVIEDTNPDLDEGWV